MKKIPLKDPLVRNIWHLTLLVFVLSLQVLIVLVFIYQFVPLKMDPITEGVPQALLKLFKPNRNHLFYHVFIAVAIIGQFLVFYFYRKSLQLPELAGEIRKFLIFETVWVTWQLFAVFKILQYDNPLWARILLYTGFIAALLGKIFWPELKSGIKYIQVLLQSDRKLHSLPLGRDQEGENKQIDLLHPHLSSPIKGEGSLRQIWVRVIDGGIIFILLLVIAIPDTEKAVLRLAIYDGNNHFDQWLMAPLWAYHKGLVPALHVFNPLNWGVPVLVNALVGFVGGVTYSHVIELLCLLAIIYYAAFYFLLRSWLGVLPAVFGVLLAVKLQMFHLGVNPLIWIYPGQSILRHLFDVAVFFCMLMFARGAGEFFLWMAEVIIGVSLAYVFDTGVYMLGALYAYLVVLMAFKDTRCLLCPSPRQWRKVLGLFLIPLLLMVSVLLSCFGPAVFHKEFWANSFTNIPPWLNGFEAVSIFSCLKERNFFAFFASFVPPVIYTMGAALTVNMVYFRRWRTEKLFLIPLSVYGLGVYSHFLWHSTINFYYMVPLPLVGCLCFWGMQILGGLNKIQQRLIKLILVIAVGMALFTDAIFTHYPNVFNMAQENWDQQKAIYRDNFNFTRDANFVWYWTSPGQQVALISGFETQILIQADRPPFFYNSMTLLNQADIQRMVEQLDKGRPAQVFIDKRLLNSAGLGPLMDYLKAHYQYSGRQSDILALLKRDHE